MLAYIVRRLLLVVPTLLGILVVNFFIIQSSPGGPVEQMIAKLQGEDVDVTERFSGEERDTELDFEVGESEAGIYQGSRGLDPELIQEIKVMYGFDKPIHERFMIMLSRYIRLDFGDSFFRDKNVIALIKEKLPVSISLGLWSTLIVYLVSIPLGIRKAVKHGSRFDVWSSTVIIFGNAVPVFLFAIVLIVLFAGGEYFEWFPLRGLTSDNFESLSVLGKLADYFWHLALPLLAMLIGSFTSLTLLTKNSFLDEINKQYVITARAKGATERRILYGHVFRNAMLIIVSGFPAAFIGMFFSSSLLIEVIFSLDGIGLLGFEAAMKRDYPVMFGTLYIFTLLGLIVGIISDVTYMLVDPRIDFENRGN